MSVGAVVLAAGPGRRFGGGKLAAELQPLLVEHGEWTLEVDPAMAPGFQVAAPDGSVVVDRTLPRRLLLEEARLRLETLQELGAP
jgi:fermentation-respiration switch protein FrsA (DUF1100 family)